MCPSVCSILAALLRWRGKSPAWNTRDVFAGDSCIPRKSGMTPSFAWRLYIIIFGKKSGDAMSPILSCFWVGECMYGHTANDARKDSERTRNTNTQKSVRAARVC